MRPLTRSCFLLLFLGRLFLLTFLLLLENCLLSLWSPPFSLHAPVPIPLCLAKVRLSPTLRFSALDRRLCFFSFWQRQLWRTCQLLSLWHCGHFLFKQAQYAQVFPSKPAPFCQLFAGLGSTNKSATSLLHFSYLTLALSSPPVLCSIFPLPQSLWQI